MHQYGLLNVFPRSGCNVSSEMATIRTKKMQSSTSDQSFTRVVFRLKIFSDFE